MHGSFRGAAPSWVTHVQGGAVLEGELRDPMDGGPGGPVHHLSDQCIVSDHELHMSRQAMPNPRRSVTYVAHTGARAMPSARLDIQGRSPFAAATREGTLRGNAITELGL